MKSIDYIVIYEFAERSDDNMVSGVVRCLRQRGRSVEYVHGFLSRYSPGGLSPIRLLNLIWVYAKVLWHGAFVRPAGIIVRTTPPGIQLWSAVCFRSSYTWRHCWLMDYHPEIEARYFETIGLAFLSNALRCIDKHFLKKFDCITVLDKAMYETLSRKNFDISRVNIYPTWGVERLNVVSNLEKWVNDKVTIVYAGNLGRAHNLSTFQKLLIELGKYKSVRVVSIGCSPESTSQFEQLAKVAGAEYSARERVAFCDLPTAFEKEGAAYGLVVLKDSASGVVSPSKYSGYIEALLPIVYIGPVNTNADLCVSQFKAGATLRNDSSDASIRRVAKELTSDECRLRFLRAAVEARDHFRSFSAAHFTSFIEEAKARHVAKLYEQDFIRDPRNS